MNLSSQYSNLQMNRLRMYLYFERLIGRALGF